MARTSTHALHLRSHLRRLAVWLLVVMAMQWLCLLVIVLIASMSSTAQAQGIPRAAQRYQATLKREAQLVWGLQAPVAALAAQVHQESRWQLDARSPVGAIGLAQFMPATATWIGSTTPSLADRDPTNPTWSLRALVTYDKWLFDRIRADNACQAMAFALSAYNGGLGWVYKRQKRSSSPGVCLDATCNINPGIAPAAQAENQHYPALILRTYAPVYQAWGASPC